MYPVSIKGVLFSPAREAVLLLNEREEWELPGGRIEPGETSAECLAREIQEELGLEVEVGRPVDTYLFEVIPGRHVFIATYRCTLAGGIHSASEPRAQTPGAVFTYGTSSESATRVPALDRDRTCRPLSR